MRNLLAFLSQFLDASYSDNLKLPDLTEKPTQTGHHRALRCKIDLSALWCEQEILCDPKSGLTFYRQEELFFWGLFAYLETFPNQIASISTKIFTSIRKALKNLDSQERLWKTTCETNEYQDALHKSISQRIRYLYYLYQFQSLLFNLQNNMAAIEKALSIELTEGEEIELEEKEITRFRANMEDRVTHNNTLMITLLDSLKRVLITYTSAGKSTQQKLSMLNKITNWQTLPDGLDLCIKAIQSKSCCCFAWKTSTTSYLSIELSKLFRAIQQPIANTQDTYEKRRQQYTFFNVGAESPIGRDSRTSRTPTSSTLLIKPQAQRPGKII